MLCKQSAVVAAASNVHYSEFKSTFTAIVRYPCVAPTRFRQDLRFTHFHHSHLCLSRLTSGPAQTLFSLVAVTYSAVFWCRGKLKSSSFLCCINSPLAQQFHKVLILFAKKSCGHMESVVGFEMYASGTTKVQQR